jgi:1-acyl-sn-glycerol-3-phosphate acyltransferase
MGKENIEKYSAFYAFWRTVVSTWHNKFFYRKIIVVGRENINYNDHLIFAPNHQNALMDALAVLCTQKAQPVFLARADIFKRKFIAAILYFLKILPIYRIRDGFENLKSNDWTFNKTIDVLKNKNGLVILPEGNQERVRRLRQLKKGIFRIAFQADEATGFTMNIKIIPVGIEFTHYSRIRQVLTVVYGRPVEIKEYYGLYRSYPQRAINELRDRLSDEMQKIMVHIEPEEDYEAIDELRDIVNGKYIDDIKNPKLFRDRRLINSLKNSPEDLYRNICSLSLVVKKKARELNTDYRLLEKKRNTLAGMMGGIFLLLITFPLFIYGLAFNYIFYAIPNYYIKNVDENFHSSVKYTISLVLAVLFMPIYFILCIAAIKPWWLGIAVFSTIPLTGIFAWNYYMLFRRIKGGLRIRKYIRTNNTDYSGLREAYKKLMSLISKL